MGFRFEPDATLCMSLASRPSRFGYTTFNTAFEHLGMRWMYLPRQVTSEAALQQIIEGIRGFGVRGVGVSMPWKTVVMPLLDGIDEEAEAIGAINTIVNDDGLLRGFNTDFYGAKKVLSDERVGAGTDVRLLGAGGVARALAKASASLGANVTVCARNAQKAHAFAAHFGADVIPWSERADTPADVVINATPVGMTPDHALSPLPDGAVKRFGLVADLVINPPATKLITEAQTAGCRTIPGYRFTLHQAVEQFELYTKTSAPVDVMEAAIQKLIGGRS